MRGIIKLCPVALLLGLAQIAALALVAPIAQAEETRLLCQGSVRNTARVYQENGTLNMRLYDRIDRLVWLRTPARSETNPEVVTYTNVYGEQAIRITANRNDPSLCSIQVGDQPPERGAVVQ